MSLLEVIREHGNPGVTQPLCDRLERLAAEHHAACVTHCNTGEDADMDKLEGEIAYYALQVGCNAAFSYDPRGCTVRLIFADGFGNTIAGGYGIGAP